jgi:hypothetical protein
MGVVSVCTVYSRNSYRTYRLQPVVSGVWAFPLDLAGGQARGMLRGCPNFNQVELAPCLGFPLTTGSRRLHWRKHHAT